MSIDFNKFQKIVVLTGAGISAESGIRTFRDAGGLWEQHRVEDVATPEAYARDPQLVWKFYSMRRLQAAQAIPNSAHLALTKFAAQLRPGQELTLITQNVDVLHQRADLHHRLEPICMHGSLHQSRCTHCQRIYFDDYGYFDQQGRFAPTQTGICDESQRTTQGYLHNQRIDYQKNLPLSPCCKQPIRPHIVWFGEIPLFMEKIQRVLLLADLFVSVGTSGQVYPAAGFLQVAKQVGAKTICINLESIPHEPWIDEFIQGKASEEVPRLFKNK